MMMTEWWDGGFSWKREKLIFQEWIILLENQTAWCRREGRRRRRWIQSRENVKEMLYKEIVIQSTRLKSMSWKRVHQVVETTITFESERSRETSKIKFTTVLYCQFLTQTVYLFPVRPYSTLYSWSINPTFHPFLWVVVAISLSLSGKWPRSGGESKRYYDGCFFSCSHV